MKFPKIKNYTVTRKTGERLCCSVFEAVYQPDDLPCVLKVLNPDLSRSEEAVFSFLNSARLATLAESPAMCEIRQFGGHGGNFFVVTEPVTSPSLSAVLKNEFPFEMGRVQLIVKRLAETLRLLHIQGVVHGLLNPASIYVCEDDWLRLDDFGSHWMASHLFKSESAEVETSYLSHYMATEVYFRSKRIDGRADNYSLAAIFLEMLTGSFGAAEHGQESFPQQRLLSALPDVLQAYPENASKLDTLLRKALNYNPESRYFNMKEFLTDLETIAPEVPKEIVRQKPSIATGKQVGG